MGKVKCAGSHQVQCNMQGSHQVKRNPQGLLFIQENTIGTKIQLAESEF
jgi:hypothetical protein